LNDVVAARPVVFDLDGTLVDSRQDLATAIDRLRSELGLAPLGLARVAAMVGEGARVLVGRALADWSSDPARLAAQLERYLVLYDEVCLDTTVLYPGIATLLEALAARRPLALLTNKPSRMTTRLLSHLGVARHFAPVVAGDTLPQRKPDPAGLQAIARALGCDVAELTLVGDSLVDLTTARAAGCDVVLVGWGFVPAARLAAAGVAPVADVAALAVRLGVGLDAVRSTGTQGRP
jgi:phosphoglycolate phosphatase